MKEALVQGDSNAGLGFILESAFCFSPSENLKARVCHHLIGGNSLPPRSTRL